MRLVFFVFFFLISSSLYSQDCKVNSFKNRREVKKIRKYIKENDYIQANLLINNTKEHPVFNALRAELLWLEGNNIQAKKIANEVLYICDEQFPVIYYLLAEIAYVEKDFVYSADFLQRSLNLGLDGIYYENETPERMAAQIGSILHKNLTHPLVYI